ncbi:MAG TPA: A/G-specific adenine glycosylase [Thermoanaerobaculia bacterium]|jgi:A/G-specific adenine glycosylase|nr:A/G-specific adenine glycosylase [Thermoanaerobaculia bacterium]
MPSNNAKKETEAGRLLSWFDRHRRDLPWRRDRDPYRVWLSEIMLQQTRVETVIPFYQAFLERFPTVEHLADAPIDAVLAAWSGLGYYRRARQLQAAAQKVAAGGMFPRTVSGLLDLPGIGPYTAAAIASICFGVAVPVLDGNVERVLARRLAEDGDVKSASVRRRLMGAATELLDPVRAGDSNQAMMELGATICVPKRPRCLLCPLAGGCKALAMGATEKYPKARSERRSEEISLVAVLVEDEEDGHRRTLLFRRPDDSSLLAGLWEVPWVDAAPKLAAAELKRRYGGSWRLGDQIGTARHGITYRDLRVAIHLGEVGEGGEVREGPEAGWFTTEEIAGLAASSLVGKILSARHRSRPPK